MQFEDLSQSMSHGWYGATQLMEKAFTAHSPYVPTTTHLAEGSATKRFRWLMPCLDEHDGSALLANKAEHHADRLQGWRSRADSREPASTSFSTSHLHQLCIKTQIPTC